jgi:UPF0716 protein FxsA
VYARTPSPSTFPQPESSIAFLPRSTVLLTLVLLFTVLPLAELYLLVWLGFQIGLLPTIAIALGTGILGASLARAQGVAVMSKLSQQLRAGERPADTLFDGALVLVAGVMLIMPGILTDITGFLLLVPPLRSVLKPLLAKALRRNVQSRDAGPGVRVWTFGSTIGQPPPPRDRVIEAEVIDVRTRNANE